MAISIDWGTKIISIPQADLVLVSAGVYELNLDTFRLALKDLEDSENGMAFPHTHDHNPPVTVGGVTLARVIEIINGYTVTFEDGQYAVNLAGANSNVSDVTNVNQVSVRAANSAGLTYSKQMEDLAFSDHRIWIDVDNGTAGTTYPLGTSTYPVNNYDDADSIAANRDLVEAFHVSGDLNIDATQNIQHHDFRGAAPLGATLNVAATVNTIHLVASNIKVTGNLNGEVDFDGCLLSDLSNFCGRAKGCGLTGNITLHNTDDLTTPHILADCKDATTDDATPVIDCGGLTGNINVRITGYTGTLKIKNFSTASSVMGIDMYSGEVILDSTCNEGTIVIRGLAGMDDNSGASCLVYTEDLQQPNLVSGAAPRAPLTAQETRDAMDLTTTGGKDSVDDKLDNNFSISAAGL